MWQPELLIATCDIYEGLPQTVAVRGAEVVYSDRFASTAVKWVSIGGSGTDHLGVWVPARAVVTNAAGIATDVMAEYGLGMMLAFTLGLRGLAKALAARCRPAPTDALVAVLVTKFPCWPLCTTAG